MAKPTRVALLDNGSMFAKDYQVFWNLPSEAAIEMPAYGVLIDHADGTYLFDTGFDLDHFKAMVGPTAQSAARQTVEQTLPAQLALLGMGCNDINYVLNSHYHFDHCGGNKHCVHARTICHQCELEAVRNPEPFEAVGYSDRSFLTYRAPEPEVDIHTRDFETLTGDQEIATGLFLFETPGHTAGHYSLMVELPGRRPMLFPADAAYTKRSLDKMLISSHHVNPVAAYKSMERLKKIAEQHDAEIFFPHDQELYPTYLKAPAWYE